MGGKVKFVLTFVPNTALYSVHAAGCSAAATTRQKNLIAEDFGSISAAVAWADQDESEKAGERVHASLSVCSCAKHVSQEAACASS